MVCEVMRFKEWKVSMSEIHRFRTKTEKLKWTIPKGYDDVGQLGQHGGKGSTRLHIELRDAITKSKNLNEFNFGVQQLVEKWKIDPKLHPELIKIQ